MQAPSIVHLTLLTYMKLFSMEPQDNLHNKHNEIFCLAAGIYFESRVKNYEESVGIGYVIKTRAQQTQNKGSYCKAFHAPYQFMTPSIKAIHKKSKFEPDAWQRSIWIAYGVHYEHITNPYPGAAYFCNPKTTKVTWCRNSIGERIGSHLFITSENFNAKLRATPTMPKRR